MPLSDQPVKIASSLLRPSLGYPVTQLLALQYMGLAVFPAVLNDNPYLPFILSLVAVALLTSALVEWLSGRARRGHRRVRTANYPSSLSIWTITLAGAFATIAAPLLGASTYSTQVGLTAASPVTTLLTPFVPWLLFGCGFALACWRAGLMSRKATILLLGIALLVQLVAVLNIGRTAGLMNFALALGAACGLVGFFRPRWLWVGLAVAVLAWPLLFGLRNSTRQEAAGLANGPTSTVTAQDRLREDLLLSQAAVYGQSLDVPQPSAIDIIRFGLVPRLLDPSRGELPSGTALNAAVGGSSSSALTFTTLGTLWSLNGSFAGVMAYVSIAAAAMGFVCRRITPTRMALAMLLVYHLIWIESTYPDNVAAVLQGFISLAAASAIVAALRNRTRAAGDDQALQVDSTANARSMS